MAGQEYKHNHADVRAITNKLFYRLSPALLRQIGRMGGLRIIAEDLEHPAIAGEARYWGADDKRAYTIAFNPPQLACAEDFRITVIHEFAHIVAGASEDLWLMARGFNTRLPYEYEVYADFVGAWGTTDRRKWAEHRALFIADGTHGQSWTRIFAQLLGRQDVNMDTYCECAGCVGRRVRLHPRGIEAGDIGIVRPETLFALADSRERTRAAKAGAAAGAAIADSPRRGGKAINLVRNAMYVVLGK